MRVARGMRVETLFGSFGLLIFFNFVFLPGNDSFEFGLIFGESIETFFVFGHFDCCK